MRYQRVYLDSIAYELPTTVMTSEALEERLTPFLTALRMRPGQIEALTGIRERRWWDPGFLSATGAALAGRRALAASDVSADQIGMLIFAGVCRDDFEPATACPVAAELGLSPETEIYDVSNACLGVMTAILQIANRIELGHIRAGMVVSCESSRDIIEIMIAQMLAEPTMEMFRSSMATLTGGSGAVALILTDGSGPSRPRPRLVGGALRAAPEHHALSRWGVDRRDPPRVAQYFEIDAAQVQRHGVDLGRRTWEALLSGLNWGPAQIDRVITHQVGIQHRDVILRTLGIQPEKEFSTFEFLGNMGTVALPITAAIAAERGFLDHGHRVAFLGIGSGLNCLMLGWEW